MSQKALLAAVVSLALAVLGLAVFWQPGAPARAGSGAAPGGDFTLQGARGPVSLRDYRGKVALLNFGYTHCPDVCPTALATVAGALRLLPPAQAARVAPLFVSVDPDRDSPAHLAEYTAFFHPALVGITGSPAAVAAVARQYGVFYARQKTASAAGYAVDHSADYYVIGPRGALEERLPFGASPEQLAAAVRRHLQ